MIDDRLIAYSIYQMLDIQNSKKQKTTLLYKLQQCLFHYPEHPNFDIHASPFSQRRLYHVRLAAVIYLGIVSIWVLSSITSLGDCIQQIQLLSFILCLVYFLLALEDRFLNDKNKLFPVVSKLKYPIQLIFEISLCSQYAFTPYFFSKLHEITNNNHTTVENLALSYNILLAPLLWLTLDLFFNTFPFPLRHIYFSFLLVIFLFASNTIYHKCIQSQDQLINWGETQSYVYLGTSLTVLMASYFSARLLYLKWKVGRIRRKDENIELSLISSPNPTKQDKQIALQNELYKQALEN